MNILILSCGTRNLLVSYFKESGFEKVIGTDCSNLAPALYFTDNYYIVPRMDDPLYFDTIKNICIKENINVVLPLQEDELQLMANNREWFNSKNILLCVSNNKTVELCRNKMAFYNYIVNNSLPSLKTYSDIALFEKDFRNKLIDFPVFIKPEDGCGSNNIHKVENLETLKTLVENSSENMIIQEYNTGDEFGVDVFVDCISNKIVSMFIKQKLRMRAGETDKSVSVKDEKLFNLIEKLICTLECKGPIDIDVFKINNEYYISEVNPRFGGGYPHAYLAGINFPKMILNNCKGNINETKIGNYEENIFAMKCQNLIAKKL